MVQKEADIRPLLNLIVEMWVDGMYDELIQEAEFPKAELCDTKLNKKQNTNKDEGHEFMTYVHICKSCDATGSSLFQVGRYLSKYE